MNFNFTYGLGTTLQQMVGIEMAGQIWSSYLKDPVTINIHVGMVSSLVLPSKVIGGALPGIQSSQKYSQVSDRLIQEAGNTGYASALSGTSDGRSFDDKVTANNFSGGINFNTKVDFELETDTTEFNSAQVLSTSILNVTRANAKALGLAVTNMENLDGYLLFSDLLGVTTSSGQSISWNYNYRGSQNAGQLDFLTTAVHEIGHILGFVSVVDRPGWMTNSIESDEQQQFIENAEQQVRNVTPLDLFRWSDFAKNDISYGTVGETGFSTDRYFSIDNGATKIADFSTGADINRSGDGSQASHWKQGTAGIMGPKLQLGARPKVSAVDLRALDVIGWDLDTTTAVSSAPKLSSDDLPVSRMLERGELNATALANRPIDLSSLQSAAIRSLATATGKTTTWINSNLNNLLAALPTTLRRDRTSEVATMIVDSVVYNWGRNKGDSVWQTMLNLFHSEGLFSSVDELEFSPEVQTTTLELSSNPQTGRWTFGFQIGRSDLNRVEMGSIEIPQGLDLGTNFTNSGVSAINPFGILKQSQFDRGSRAWDSKGKRIAEKVIPQIESLDFGHHPQELVVGESV